MYEHQVKKNPRNAASQTGTTAADRRNADRHTFTASAEVVELSSGARFSARTTDLGPGGCFVDTMLPFPVGAEVRVTVSRGQTRFETNGFVVYSQTGLGMGIAFNTLEPHQREALEDWLTELTGSKQNSARDAIAQAARGSTSVKGAETSATVRRFVQLMISKGLITEAEGASVLHDPVL